MFEEKIDDGCFFIDVSQCEHSNCIVALFIIDIVGTARLREAAPRRRVSEAS